MPQIRIIIRLVKPVQALLAMLSFGVGLGLAHYLGANFRLVSGYVGGILVLLLFAGSNLLTEYFRPQNDPIIDGESRQEREQIRTNVLISGDVFLLLAAVCVYFLLRDGRLFAELGILIGLAFILSLAAAVPPIRLGNRGLGELVTVLLLTVISPGIAFLTSFGTFHPFLLVYCLLLFFPGLAFCLANNFREYARDVKYGRRSMLVGMGWENAVNWSRFSAVLPFILLAILPFLGLPFRLAWPGFFALPAALLLIYLLGKIEEGDKPNWPLFTTSAVMLFGLLAYLFAFTLYLN